MVKIRNEVFQDGDKLVVIQEVMLILSTPHPYNLITNYLNYCHYNAKNLSNHYELII